MTQSFKPGSEVKNYSFPQQSEAAPAGERGIASLTHGNRTFRFRTNPNQFNWNYQLIKRGDQTYGGRVVQLLGVNIGSFKFKVETGKGRWPYMNDMMVFLRDVMIAQRNGVPATFEYTTRGWKLNCYLSNFPFQDQVEVASQEIEIETKVQEDVSGLMSQLSVGAELRRLQDGMGWSRSVYNDPIYEGPGQQPYIPGINDIEKGLGDLTRVLGYTSDPWVNGGSMLTGGNALGSMLGGG